MDAKRCDRCEVFYMPYKGDGKSYYSNMLIFSDDNQHGGYVEIRRFELCPNCIREAQQFMQEKIAEKEESACGQREP